MKRIRRFRSNGKLLDVGSGVGYFVKEALENGFEAEGIEFSSDAAKIGQQHFHLNIHFGDLFTVDFPKNSFDIITLWQVLEHMQNPQKVLRKVHYLLKTEGLLAIAVPNFSSFQSKIFQDRWYHLEIPRHLFHYDPICLDQLLQKNGFDIESINFFSKEHNWAGILGSVIRLSAKNESLIHKVFRKSVGFYCSRLLAWVESALKLGGTFEVYAVRR